MPNSVIVQHQTSKQYGMEYSMSCQWKFPYKIIIAIRSSAAGKIPLPCNQIEFSVNGNFHIVTSSNLPKGIFRHQQASGVKTNIIAGKRIKNITSRNIKKRKIKTLNYNIHLNMHLQYGRPYVEFNRLKYADPNLLYKMITLCTQNLFENFKPIVLSCIFFRETLMKS